MTLFFCEYRYATPVETGHGRMLVLAKSEDEAKTKCAMIGGADSSVTDITASECHGGFYRLGHRVDETETEIVEREKTDRARRVAPKFAFDVAARAEVIAADRWDAYRKLGALVKQENPPPGLKRKVVAKEPVDNVSRWETNSQLKHVSFLQGGAARPK